MKRKKTLVSIAVVLLLCLSLAYSTAAMAVQQSSFPLMTIQGDKLIADANTEYITQFAQNPATGLITATLQIRNGSTGTQDLHISGIGIEISWDNRVAPYAHDPLVTGYDNSRFFPAGKSVENSAEFSKYCKPLRAQFNVFGSQIIERESVEDSGRGMLGAKLSCTNDEDELKIAPGQTMNVVEFYFMPLNPETRIDLGMFSYEFAFDTATFTRVSTWIGNGSRFLVATSRNMPGEASYVVSPGAFKIHVQRPAPVVSANNTARTIVGYDPATMEWAYIENGPYSSGTPDVRDEAHTIYVRARGDAAYSGGDELYGNYKRYLTSSATPVAFDAVEQAQNVVVTFDPVGGILQGSATKTVTVGEAYGQLPGTARSGYTFIGWFTQPSGGSNINTTTIVTNNQNHTIFAHWQVSDIVIPPEEPPLPGFETDHIPYIIGYPDNSVRPDNPITRAEVALIFFRLLSSTEKNTPLPTTFYDVPIGFWYTQAINYLASIDIIEGYPDGSFRPNQPITRAEFATMASKFDNLETISGNAFPDVAYHWAKDYINSAYAKGWVSGYPDGTFKPEQNITRAEVVTVVNAMLNRGIRIQDIPTGIRMFNDFAGHWAYTDIVEASNAHDYIRHAQGHEIWTLK